MGIRNVDEYLALGRVDYDEVLELVKEAAAFEYYRNLVETLDVSTSPHTATFCLKTTVH